MENIGIGFKIKQIREQKNLSQEQLANLLKISQSKLSKIESGRLKKIELELILKFCQSVGIDTNVFFDQNNIADQGNIT